MLYEQNPVGIIQNKTNMISLSNNNISSFILINCPFIISSFSITIESSLVVVYFNWKLLTDRFHIIDFISDFYNTERIKIKH